MNAIRLSEISLTVALAMAGTAARGEAPAPLSTFKDCQECPEMVALPPGKFLMGASKEDRKLTDSIESELPQHEVTIDYSFAIGRFEVTVAEFAAYVADTGAKTGGECQIRTPDLGPNKGKFVGTLKVGAPENMPGLVVITDGDFKRPGAIVSDQYPATCISRPEALAYLAWLSKKSGRAYRFPSEAEWEYATRAGSATPFFFRRAVRDLCKYANFADRKSPYGAGMAAPCAEQPSPAGVAPVGSYRPNDWDLFDTVGNDFEFIEDCRFPDYHGAPTDGSPWREGAANTCSTGFASRGFFFDSVYTDMRSAARCTAGSEWDERGSYLALRIAVSLNQRAWDRK